MPDVLGGLALLPLTSKAFLSGLSKAEVKSVVVRWENLRSQARDDFDRLAGDLVLEASYRQLGLSLEQRRAAERIAHNPVLTAVGANPSGVVNPARGVTDEVIDSLRALLSATAMGMQTQASGP